MPIIDKEKKREYDRKRYAQKQREAIRRGRKEEVSFRLPCETAPATNRSYLRVVNAMKTINALKKEIEQKRLEHDTFLEKQRDISRTVSTLKRELLFLENDLQRAERRESINITDHAVARYMERVEGRDRIQIAQTLLSESMVKQIQTLGNGCYPVTIQGKPFQIVVKKNKVVTIF